MKQFTKLLKRQLRATESQIFFISVVLTGIYILIDVVLAISMNTSSHTEITNFFFNTFKGVGYIRDIKKIEIPVFWIMINSFIFYIVGSNIQKDFDTTNIYIITRCGRRTYWICQVINSIIITIAYYIIIFSLTYIIGKIFVNNYYTYLDWTIIILYITTSLMFLMIMFFLAFMMDFKYYFLIILILMVISILSKSNMLPGQHSMILRHVPYDCSRDLTIIKSLIYNFVVGSVFFALGFFASAKKEMK